MYRMVEKLPKDGWARTKKNTQKCVSVSNSLILTACVISITVMMFVTFNRVNTLASDVSTLVPHTHAVLRDFDSRVSAFTNQTETMLESLGIVMNLITTDTPATVERFTRLIDTVLTEGESITRQVQTTNVTQLLIDASGSFFMMNRILNIFSENGNIILNVPLTN